MTGDTHWLECPRHGRYPRSWGFCPSCNLRKRRSLNTGEDG